MKSLNENKLNVTDQPATPTGGPCQGSFPNNCNFDNTCGTQARWTYNEANQDITFTIETISDLSSDWNGIGFSADTFMVRNCHDLSALKLK